MRKKIIMLPLNLTVTFWQNNNASNSIPLHWRWNPQSLTQPPMGRRVRPRPPSPSTFCITFLLTASSHTGILSALSTCQGHSGPKPVDVLFLLPEIFLLVHSHFSNPHLLALLDIGWNSAFLDKFPNSSVFLITLITSYIFPIQPLYKFIIIFLSYASFVHWTTTSQPWLCLNIT